jgi:hypothetical protein
MPSTYTLIKGETIGSSAASYTFTAIPSTFTDLVVRMSLRGDVGGRSNAYTIVLNGNTGNVYSRTRLYADGSTVTSAREATGNPRFPVSQGMNGTSSTANTFNNDEIYIPNYTVSANKQISQFVVVENNDTPADMQVQAMLFQSTAAVTSILLTPAANFVSGSSFYLYGISKS